MTKRMMVHVLTGMSTKDEEKEVLQKFVEAAGPQSYLASLFTPELVALVEKAINDDTSANVYEMWQWDVTRLLEQNKLAHANYEAEHQENVRVANLLRAEIAALKETNQRQQHIIDVQHAQLDNWQDEGMRRSERIASLADQVQKLGDELLTMKQERCILGNFFRDAIKEE